LRGGPTTSVCASHDLGALLDPSESRHVLKKAKRRRQKSGEGRQDARSLGSPLSRVWGRKKVERQQLKVPRGKKDLEVDGSPRWTTEGEATKGGPRDFGRGMEKPSKGKKERGY